MMKLYHPRDYKMNNLVIFLIKSYQKILSPLFGKRCRFYPSCSNQCVEAIRQHGTLKGLYLGIKRILSCHPWNDGGYDPVKLKDFKKR